MSSGAAIKREFRIIWWSAIFLGVLGARKAEALLKFEAILATSWSQFGMIQVLWTKKIGF